VAALRVWRLALGGLLGLAGIIWLLQGVGVLPGSFMTGSAFWAVVGAVLIVAGGGLVYWGTRGPA
jgi:hypothetical protein